MAQPHEESGPPQNRSQSSQRSFFRRRGFWIVVLLLAGAGLYSCLKKPATSEVEAGGDESGGRHGAGMANRMMPVGVATAATGDIRVYQTGLGTVTPLTTVTVKSRVTGQLMSVAFQEGQLVKQGDVLAEIDPRPYEAALLAAQGQLKKDQAALKNAQLDLERDRVLLSQKATTQQTYDTQTALVMQDEGAVDADQGNVNNAQLNVEYSHITAPASGRVGLRQVDPGNIIQSTDTNGLVVITEMQPMGVIFTIPEDNLPDVLSQLQAGQKLGVDAYDRAFQTKLASGTLLTTDNQIDTSTGTVKLKATFPNEDYKLFPNQFVNVQVLVRTLHDQVLVPTAAIQEGAQSSKFVYVVESGQTVKVQKVTPGLVDGDNTAINEGLQAGQVVVVDGADKLRDGAKVQVSPPGNGAATPAGSPRAGGQHHHRQTS